jgi:hypothetical protein
VVVQQTLITQRVALREYINMVATFLEREWNVLLWLLLQERLKDKNGYPYL